MLNANQKEVKKYLSELDYYEDINTLKKYILIENIIRQQPLEVKLQWEKKWRKEKPAFVYKESDHNKELKGQNKILKEVQEKLLVKLDWYILESPLKEILDDMWISSRIALRLHDMYLKQNHKSAKSHYSHRAVMAWLGILGETQK